MSKLERPIDLYVYCPNCRGNTRMELKGLFEQPSGSTLRVDECVTCKQLVHRVADKAGHFYFDFNPDLRLWLEDDPDGRKYRALDAAEREVCGRGDGRLMSQDGEFLFMPLVVECEKLLEEVRKTWKETKQ